MAPPAPGGLAAAPGAAPTVVGDYEWSSFEQQNKLYDQRVKNQQLDTLKSGIALRESGPQGKVEPVTLIKDPADWKSSDFGGSEEAFTFDFTPEHVMELKASVEALKARGVSTEDDIKALTAADYNLPTLAPELLKVAAQVSSGRGFQILAGFPVEEYRGDRVGLVLAFWALALTIGRPLVSQTDHRSDGKLFGSLLNHITVGRWTDSFQVMREGTSEVVNANVEGNNADVKQAAKEHISRINTNRLQFHTDQGATDIIALLCISQSISGGRSKWVSAVALHNELLRRGRQDLVEVLSTPGIWKTALKTDQQAYARNPDGSLAGFEEAVPFNYHDGYLSIHFEPSKLSDSKLTPLQEEALWTLAALAEDPSIHFARRLKRGEMLWIHNPTIFHARDDVVDGEDNKDKRHLLRWWVHTHQNPRPVSKYFAPRSNVFPEGGFKVPREEKLRLPLYPYSRHDGEGQSPSDA